MRTLVTAICILFAAILLVSPRTGFAYQNVNQGCATCHPAPAGTGLHTPHASLTCGICHAGGVPGKNVEASACIVCHPRGNTGLCPVIDLPAHASQKTTCLGCHPSCAPATTTTTAAGTNYNNTGHPPQCRGPLQCLRLPPHRPAQQLQLRKMAVL